MRSKNFGNVILYFFENAVAIHENICGKIIQALINGGSYMCSTGEREKQFISL